jgi:hypothetical protein
MITALTSRLTNFTVKAIGNDGDLSEASNSNKQLNQQQQNNNSTQTTSSSTFFIDFQQMKLLQGTMFINNEVLVNDTVLLTTNYAVAGLASTNVLQV